MSSLLRWIALLTFTVFASTGWAQSNLAVTGDFERTIDPWYARKFAKGGLVRAPEMIARHAFDDRTLSRGALLLATEKAEGSEDPSQRAGAVCPMTSPVEKGTTLRVSFRAQSIDGTPSLVIAEKDGRGHRQVTLSKSWTTFEVEIESTQRASALVFALIEGQDRRLAPALASGRALLDNVRVTISSVSSLPAVHFRADQCALDSSAAMLCEDLNEAGVTASSTSTDSSPLRQDDGLGGRPALIMDGDDSLAFHKNQSIGPDLTAIVVAQCGDTERKVLELGSPTDEKNGSIRLYCENEGGNVALVVGSPDESMRLEASTCSEDSKARGAIFAVITAADGVYSLQVNGGTSRSMSMRPAIRPLEGVLGTDELTSQKDATSTISEVRLFDSVLSTYEQAAIIEELRERYGLSACSVPASCGNGRIDPGEMCDPAEDRHCDSDCRGLSADRTAETSCRDGVDDDGDGLVDCADVWDCQDSVLCRAKEQENCASDRTCAVDLVCVDGSCRRPHCQNSIRDAEELGRDCGGPCQPCDGTQCDSACRVGELTQPDAQATLHFASGKFSRNSVGTYDSASGQLEVARVHELRWVVAGNTRLALFEGRSTNVLRFSEVMDDSAWSEVNGRLFIASNQTTAPDGRRTAELWSSSEGMRPIQHVALPGPRSTMSVWLKVHPKLSAESLVAGPIAELEGMPDVKTLRPIGAEWNRESLTFTGEPDVEVAVGISKLPTTAAPVGVENPSNLAIWGAQLEPQPFPTSYIVTEGKSAIREEDSLVIEGVPDWFRHETWQVDVQPLFGSNELKKGWRHTLFGFDSGHDIALVANQDERSAKLVINGRAGDFASTNLIWTRGDRLTLTFDLRGAKVTIVGASEGDGTYDVDRFSLPAAKVRVGGAWPSGGEAFAAISEPRQVLGPWAPCVLDPSCTCGNGKIEHDERCDPALDKACNSRCEVGKPVLCDDDDDCPTGASCGLGDGPRFGLATTTNVCWPSGLCGGPNAPCGENSPCGDCVCIPNCSHVVCGESNDDGCGGHCAGSCADGQIGGLGDVDCGPLSALAEGQGPSFGHAPGTNACWPAICEDAIQRRQHCGTVDAQCGLCPDEPNECNRRECGADRFGHQCGTCKDGGRCDPLGRCSHVERLPRELPVGTGLADALRDEPADPVGHIPGEFSVDRNGAAAYSIPIGLPPGRAGLTPKLDIRYVSGLGDGFIGTGWTLAGLSSITRCPKTFRQHRVARGIQLNADDAFCIDGQLLVSVGQGRYRTEIDSFLRVQAVGEQATISAGSKEPYTGPAYFEVVTKDGQKLTYGRTFSARVQARRNGQTAINVSWMLETVEDVHGNRIQVTYIAEEHNRDGFVYTSEIRPETIAYGDNGSHVVHFSYHPDMHVWAARSFRAGIARHFSSPIEHVSVWIDGANVRTYRLDSTLRDDRWQLDSIKVCAPSPGEERCLSPTTFRYTPSGKGISKIATTNDAAGKIPFHPNYKGKLRDAFEPDNVDDWSVAAIDYDGDGRSDLLHSRFEGRGRYVTRRGGEDDPTKLYMRRSHPMQDGSAFDDLGPTTDMECEFIMPVDFDHDGREDYIAACDNNALIWPRAVVRSTNDGFEVHTTASLGGGVDATNGGRGLNIGDIVSSFEVPVDLNGDGQMDFLSCFGTQGQSILRYQSNDSGKLWTTATLLLDPYGLACSSPIRTIDYDGDGVAEPVLFRVGKANVASILAISLDERKALRVKELGPSPCRAGVSGTAIGTGVIASGSVDATFIDANGDGLKDLICRDDKGVPELHLSTGNGFWRATRAPTPPRSDLYKLFPHAVVFDVDSDGIEELLIPTEKDGWVVHSPYGSERGGRAWTTKTTQLAFHFARMKDKRKTRVRYGYQAPFPMDWDGDGVLELLTREVQEGRADNDPVFGLWKAGPRTQGLLERITDGSGKTIEVTYDSRPAGYRHGECKYPQKCLRVLPQPVVTTHVERGTAGTFDDPEGRSTREIAHQFEYAYEDARADLRGPGWLGFRKRSVREFSAEGTLIRESEFTYDLEYRVEGSPYLLASFPQTVSSRSITRTAASASRSQAIEHGTIITNQWKTNLTESGSMFVGLEERSTRFTEREASVGALQTLGEKRDVFHYDPHGNTYYATTFWNDGRVTFVGTTYVDSKHANWSNFERRGLYGLVESVRVLTYGGPAIETIEGYGVRFRYEGEAGERGLPTTIERININGTSLSDVEQTTTIAYDRFGNEVGRTLSGRDAVTQSYSTDFDPRGLFPVAFRNGVYDRLSAKTELGVDPRVGKAQWIVEPDGSWSVVNYDAFGRAKSVADSTGRRSRNEYLLGGASGGTLTVRSTATGSADKVTEYNAFGLPIQTRITEWMPARRGPGTRVAEIGYDSRGRTVAEGVSHFEGTPSPAAHYYSYDDLDRLEEELHPHESDRGEPTSSRVVHEWGSSAFPTDEATIPWREIVGGVWSHRKREVASGAMTTAVTDVRGNAVGVVDGIGTLTRNLYGAFERLRISSTPASLTRFDYDAVGNLTRMYTQDCGVQLFTYDGMGLLRTRQRGSATTAYSYDALGRVHASESSDGSYRWNYDGDGSDRTLIGHLASDSVQSARIGNTSSAYEYHNLGAMLSRVHRRIDAREFDTVIDAPEYGRVARVIYPENSLSVGYEYEATNGRLIKVTTDEGARTIWSLEDIDQFGHVTKAKLGNGRSIQKTYQATTGRLHHATTTDQAGGNVFDQAFGYDSRGLLEVLHTTNGTKTDEHFVHDVLGRLRQRRIEGDTTETYNYDSLGNLTEHPQRGQLFYEGAGPHQVTRTSDGGSFRYTDGNQTHRAGPSVPGGEQELKYTAFDLPYEIEVGTGGSTHTAVHWNYDANHHRVLEIAQSGAKTYYAGDLYRVTEGATDSEDERVARVPTPDGLTVEAQLGTGAVSLRFLDTDHLGSVRGVASERGESLERRGYDPFGASTSREKRRSKAGFTGHLDDAGVGLINMGGRMYDPGIGRFLSPDPIVQDPLNSQSWNPYSYVMNSPLAATDPTGFKAEDDVGASGAPPVAAIGGDVAPPGVDLVPTAIAKPDEVAETDGEYSPPDFAGIMAEEPVPSRGGGGGQLYPTPVAALLSPQDIPVGPLEAISKFGMGVVQGFVSTNLITAGIGYAAGTLGATVGASAAPVVVGVAAIGVTVWGVYALANGGGGQILGALSRVVNGQGTSGDWQLAGSLVGGGLGAFRSGAVMAASMEAASADIAAAEVLGVAARGPRATRSLAREIADVEVGPMSNRRTVAVMETKEGPTLISGGASDLSAAQKSAAAARGLTVVPDFPGVHAEGTALNGAGQLGLTPTRGATSNIICPNCRSLINDLGGKITTSRTFKF